MLETEKPTSLSPAQAWNKYADSYLQTVDGLNPNNGKGKRFRELVLYPHIFQTMGDLTDKEVLDAGTGEGSVARLALHKNAKRATGIDISVPLMSGKRKIKQSGTSCRR